MVSAVLDTSKMHQAGHSKQLVLYEHLGFSQPVSMPYFIGKGTRKLSPDLSLLTKARSIGFTRNASVSGQELTVMFGLHDV